MIKQIKDTARAGVTLVELLVVILIVTILAVTLLPMFQRYVVEAQYAAEPIPLIGHIRTQIGLYMYENNALPCNPDLAATDFPQVTRITKEGNGQFTVKEGKLDTAGNAPTTAVTTHYLSRMGLSLNEFIGKKVTPDQMEFAVLKNDAGYGYAIGMFGRKGGLPQGTGYAVCEYYFPLVELSSTPGQNQNDPATVNERGYKLVGTWKYYGKGLSGDGNNQIHFNLGTEIASTGSCPLFAYPTTEPKQLSAIQALIDGTGSNWQFPKVGTATSTP